MIESKCMNVLPDDENSMIAQMQTFGWELAGCQELKSCVKLIFQRDTNMIHYSRLRTLEKEFFVIPSPRFNFFPVIMMILSIIGAVATIGWVAYNYLLVDTVLEQLDYILVGAGAGCILLAILFGVWHGRVLSKYDIEKETADREREERRIKKLYVYDGGKKGVRRKRQKLLKEARKLLKNEAPEYRKSSRK